jgi:hypothetical protein
MFQLIQMMNFLFFIKCQKSKCGKTDLLTCCEQCYLDAKLFHIRRLFFSLESFQIQRTADCLLASFPVIGTTKRNEKPIMNSNYSLEENQVAQSIIQYRFTFVQNKLSQYSDYTTKWTPCVLLPAEENTLSFTNLPRLALWPTQPPVQWIQGAFSLGIEWPRWCEAMFTSV